MYALVILSFARPVFNSSIVSFNNLRLNNKFYVIMLPLSYSQNFNLSIAINDSYSPIFYLTWSMFYATKLYNCSYWLIRFHDAILTSNNKTQGLLAIIVSELFRTQNIRDWLYSHPVQSVLILD